MKVAYILARFPNLTTTFILDELLGIRKEGLDIEILSLFQPEPGPVHERSRQLMPHVHYAPAMSAQTLSAFSYYALRKPTRLARALASAIRYTFREPKLLLRTLQIIPKSIHFAHLLKGSGINHIHAHFVTVPAVAGKVLSILLDVGLTIQPHAVGLFSRNQKSVRGQLEDASGIVTISEYHRDYVASLCPRIDRDEIAIVHCGIQTDRFRRSRDRPTGQPFRILSVGRLAEKKGHSHLIDACAVLDARGMAFNCEIVGDGPLEKELLFRIEQLGLEGKVHLLGALSQDRILTRCQTSDAFALPCVVAKNGDRDGLPVALMEAMACELPVVTTPVAGIPDLVEHEVTGLLVEPGNASGLADALERLSGDHPLAAGLGRRGREHVLDEFEISRNAARMADFFRATIRNTP